MTEREEWDTEMVQNFPRSQVKHSHAAYREHVTANNACGAPHSRASTARSPSRPSLLNRDTLARPPRADCGAAAGRERARSQQWKCSSRSQRWRARRYRSASRRSPTTWISRRLGTAFTGPTWSRISRPRHPAGMRQPQPVRRGSAFALCRACRRVGRVGWSLGWSGRCCGTVLGSWQRRFRTSCFSPPCLLLVFACLPR